MTILFIVEQQIFMSKTIVISDGEETTEIELDVKLLDFYKKETQKTKVTQKGLIKFFSNMLNLRNYIV